MNVYLIGYRGTGKSTVAARLAELWHWEFVDADVELEQAAGRSIREIFASDGEEAFRDLETATLAGLSRRRELVVGVGGGGVLRLGNQQLLRASGKIVWLTARPETIFRRIFADPLSEQRRPNLTNAGGLTEIEALLAARTPIYRSLADCVVDTEDKTPDDIAAEIAAALPRV